MVMSVCAGTLIRKSPRAARYSSPSCWWRRVFLWKGAPVRDSCGAKTRDFCISMSSFLSLPVTGTNGGCLPKSRGHRAGHSRRGKLHHGGRVQSPQFFAQHLQRASTSGWHWKRIGTIARSRTYQSYDSIKAHLTQKLSGLPDAIAFAFPPPGHSRSRRLTAGGFTSLSSRRSGGKEHSLSGR